MAGPWKRGQTVVLREVWRGRVWTAMPAIVVRDRTEERLLYIPPGASMKYAVDEEGRELRLYAASWSLADHVTTLPVLSFSWPNRAHAVLAMWDSSWRFRHWYVNLESALRRTDGGIDFVDHCLDALVAPDRTGWSWKDEDELAEAVRRGLFTRQDAESFRAEGERAVRRVVDGEPPFDRDWTGWRPDPAWPVPRLPPGWDVL